MLKSPNILHYLIHNKSDKPDNIVFRDNVLIEKCIKVENKLPESWRDNYKELIKRINTSLRGYVGGVIIIMVLVFSTKVN